MLREGRLQRLVRVQGTRLMAEITAVIPYTCVALCYLHRGVVGRISHHLHLEIERCSLHREPRDGTLAFPKLPLGERLETIVLALGAGQKTVPFTCRPCSSTHFARLEQVLVPRAICFACLCNTSDLVNTWLIKQTSLNFQQKTLLGYWKAVARSHQNLSLCPRHPECGPTAR